MYTIYKLRKEREVGLKRNVYGIRICIFSLWVFRYKLAWSTHLFVLVFLRNGSSYEGISLTPFLKKRIGGESRRKKGRIGQSEQLKRMKRVKGEDR